MKRIYLLIASVLLVLYGCEREFHPDNFDGDYGFLPESNYSDAEVELGRSLFFDKILSGNKNISCATCHHPSMSSADGLALSFGEGGTGVGLERKAGEGKSKAHRLIARNSPALFNLGSNKITALFHDGRIEVNKHFPNGVFSPEGKRLRGGLETKLSVQAMFPVTSRFEMAGFSNENPLAKSAHKNRRGEVWNALGDRVRYKGAYMNAFKDVYGQSQMSLRYVDIANAIGAFVDMNFRSISSPFDAYIQGDKDALSSEQKKGMDLFYGKAQCSSCHSGVFQTDNLYHSIGLPQVGPGKFSVQRVAFSDLGRELVTQNPKDRYKFRTPSLRNVELTAPYGHSGAYKTMTDILEHHIDPEKKMFEYKCPEDLQLPSYGGKAIIGPYDCVTMSKQDMRRDIVNSHELPEISLDKKEKLEILSFLRSLTDESMIERRDEIPEAVLSGLPVKD